MSRKEDIADNDKTEHCAITGVPICAKCGSSSLDRDGDCLSCGEPREGCCKKCGGDLDDGGTCHNRACGREDYIAKHLRGIVGAKIIDVYGEPGEWAHDYPVIVIQKGKRKLGLVIYQDEEGNGPGWVEVVDGIH